MADARRLFEDLWQQLDVVPFTTELVRQVGELAERDGLRAYDATHLAAALAVSVDTLASGDGQLCQAATTHQLHIANPTEQ